MQFFQLHAVAHHGARAHQRAAPDEGAVAHLRLGTDDAGRAEKCGGRDLGGLCHPYPRLGLVVFVGGQALAQLHNKILQLVQHLPGPLLALEQRGGQGVGEIEQFFGAANLHIARSLPMILLSIII